MKNIYLFLGFCCLFSINLQAQFEDDMESYTDGESISEGHWLDWNCGGGEGCSLMSTSVRHRSGSLSGLIPGDGTTNTILDLGNKIFGKWSMEFWVYIPEGKEGAMSLQGIIPFEEGNNIVGNIYFNKDLASPGLGLVSDSALGDVSFNFPHNEWFRIVMYWDIASGISAATWLFHVDGVSVIQQGTDFTNELGEPAQHLGGLEFFSNSTDNKMYIDDFTYQEEFISLNTDSFDYSGFKIYPNPAKDVLAINSDETINKIIFYDVMGKLVFITSEINSINISSFAKGMYFVVVETENGSDTQKLIKD